MDKMALTIKQGFALPKKELTVFDGDPLQNLWRPSIFCMNPKVMELPSLPY